LVWWTTGPSHPLPVCRRLGPGTPNLARRVVDASITGTTRPIITTTTATIAEESSDGIHDFIQQHKETTRFPTFPSIYSFAYYSYRIQAAMIEFDNENSQILFTIHNENATEQSKKVSYHTLRKLTLISVKVFSFTRMHFLPTAVIFSRVTGCKSWPPSFNKSKRYKIETPMINWL